MKAKELLREIAKRLAKPYQYISGGMEVRVDGLGDISLMNEHGGILCQLIIDREKVYTYVPDGGGGWNYKIFPLGDPDLFEKLELLLQRYK